MTDEQGEIDELTTMFQSTGGGVTRDSPITASKYNRFAAPMPIARCPKASSVPAAGARAPPALSAYPPAPPPPP